MKVTRHFSRKTNDAKLKLLWSSRMSDRAIARKLGFGHPWTMRRHAAKLGLPLRRKIWTAAP